MLKLEKGSKSYIRMYQILAIEIRIATTYYSNKLLVPWLNKI